MPRNIGLGAALLCALALALLPATAAAVPVGHIFDHEFGVGGSGSAAGQFAEFLQPSAGSGIYGMDFDQSTGDLYVADPGNHRVQKFNADGDFLLAWGFGVLDGKNELQVCHAPGPCLEGLAGDSPGQMQAPTWLAVDNSGGGNDGNVYVLDHQRKLILKYGPSGSYLGAIDASTTPGGVFQSMPSNGLAVDSNGLIWVVDSLTGGSSRVMRFSGQGANGYVGGSQWDFEVPRTDGSLDKREISSLVPKPDGTALYVYSSLGTGGSGINEVSSNGARVQAKLKVGGELLMNDANGHVFVGDQEYDENVEPVGDPFSEGTLPVGVLSSAVDETTGVVYAFNGVTGKIGVYRVRRVSEAVTEPPTAVLPTTATIHGHTAPDPFEGGDVTECHFQWGLTTSYENVAPCSPAAPLSDPTAVHADLSGLLTENLYHFRLVTANSIGVNRGKDMSFVPHAVLGMTNDGAVELTATTARLRASFEANEDPITYHFEYGTNPDNLDFSTPTGQAGDGLGTTQLTAQISGLEDHTYYFYRLIATNSVGTSEGPVEKFQTAAPDPPAVGAATASGVTAGQALLSATVTPHFGETFYGFEFGDSQAYGSQVLSPTLLPADDQAHEVELPIDGLVKGQTYHFRAIALNFGGVSYGPDATFRTPDVPQVLSATASSVGTSTARLEAFVLPGLSPTTVHFEYGSSASYGRLTPGIAIGAGEGVSVSSQLAGLAPGTGYHYRVVAENAIGSVAGTDQVFTTSPGDVRPPEPTRCRRGFVKRGDRCVKKGRRCKRGSARSSAKKGGKCRKKNHKRQAGGNR